MTVAHRPRHLPGRGVAHDGALENGHLPVEHGDVYLLPVPGLFTVIEGCGNAGEQEEPAGNVANGRARLRRGITGMAGHAHDAAEGLHDEVIRRLVAPRACLPKAGHGRVDQTWIRLSQLVVS